MWNELEPLCLPAFLLRSTHVTVLLASPLTQKSKSSLSLSSHKFRHAHHHRRVNLSAVTSYCIDSRKMIAAITTHALALLAAHLATGKNGVGAFVPSSLSTRNRAIIQPSSPLFLADENNDAPDHMPVIEEVAPTYDAHVTHPFDRYKLDHAKSLSNNAQFWNQRATELLSWDHYPFDENNCDGIMTGGFEYGDVTWFAGARMNICYNAVDRHAQDPTTAKKVAMIWEGDEPGQTIEFTYADLQRKISEVSFRFGKEHWYLAIK